MSDLFERISEPFDVELRKQVDILWPREVERLEAHGLAQAKTVLDLGTGNGYFLSRLAERHPGKTFTGVEAAPSLAKIARRWQAEGRKNMRIVEGACPLSSLEDRFDLVVARLALYSMPARDAVLRWARGLLTEGGRIVVIDTDDGLKSCSPPSDFWKLIVGAITREIGARADREIGRKLPHMLLQAGFSDVRFEVQPWFSSFDLGPEAFADFWGGTARQLAAERADLFGAGELERFLALVDDIARSPDKTALCAMCVVSARK